MPFNPGLPGRSSAGQPAVTQESAATTNRHLLGNPVTQTPDSRRAGLAVLVLDILSGVCQTRLTWPPWAAYPSWLAMA